MQATIAATAAKKQDHFAETQAVLTGFSYLLFPFHLKKKLWKCCCYSRRILVC
jgi:hypothetical protein